MDDDLLLTVVDVRVAVPAGNGVEAGLVVLEETAEPHRRLRVYVGQPEARAIHVSWSATVPERPSTWDLFVSAVSLLDARIDRVVITDVQEERHFFAQTIINRSDAEEPLVLTSRPSDAIALALRTYGAEVFARPHVLDEAGRLADGSRWVRPQPEIVPDVEEVAPLGGPLTGQASHGTAPTETAYVDTALPDTALPGTALSGTALPGTALPDTAPPETQPPEVMSAAPWPHPADTGAAGDSGYGDPGADDPGTGDPGTGDSTIDEDADDGEAGVPGWIGAAVEPGEGPPGAARGAKGDKRTGRKATVKKPTSARKRAEGDKPKGAKGSGSSGGRSGGKKR